MKISVETLKTILLLLIDMQITGRPFKYIIVKK